MLLLFVGCLCRWCISIKHDLETRSSFNPFEDVGKCTFPKGMWVRPALVTSRSFVRYICVDIRQKSLTRWRGEDDRLPNTIIDMYIYIYIYIAHTSMHISGTRQGPRAPYPYLGLGLWSRVTLSPKTVPLNFPRLLGRPFP